MQHSRSSHTKTEYTNTCAQHYFHLFSYLFIRVSMSILCVHELILLRRCFFFSFAFTFSHYYLSYIRANIYIVRMFIRLRCCWFFFRLLLLHFILLYFLFHFMLMPLFLSCCFFAVKQICFFFFFIIIFLAHRQRFFSPFCCVYPVSLYACWFDSIPLDAAAAATQHHESVCANSTEFDYKIIL